MDKTNRILLFANLIVVGSLVSLLMWSFKGDSDDKPQQLVRSISLDKDFDFCGEPLPMDNPDVMERLDAELLRNVYFHSQTILALKRANAIFPVIESIMRDAGVPSDLRYLAVAESNLSNAVSPAGAKGVWQFMKGTAEQYGLEVNTEVDERYHLEKATVAACRYMKDLKNSLGSWTLAAAAYNGGPGRIREERNKQRAEAFYDLNLAAEETMRYPFRIVAIKEVMQHPESYEYFVDKSHLYKPLTNYKTVKVQGPVDSWADFSRQNGVSYRTFKLYNPWLVDSKLTNKSGKTYDVRIPSNR
jgi:hypothetical protein